MNTKRVYDTCTEKNLTKEMRRIESCVWQYL